MHLKILIAEVLQIFGGSAVEHIHHLGIGCIEEKLDWRHSRITFVGR